MDIIEKLKDQGWYLTEDAIKKLPDDVDKSDTKKIIQTVMDMDLRGIAEGALPSEISKKNDSILGHRVLQITKIRNLSAPKANEESKVAPRFLQIELTDGVNQIFALEIDNISSISLNTPPGTKLYLRSDRIPLMQGQLVLRSNDIQILGGKVNNLIEKWDMTRTLQKYSKSGNRMMIMSGSSGPPPWIAFGQKIQQNIAGNNDKNFKSLSGTGGDKENKEKNEFDTMRSEAIAEAAKAGSKKIFGGGNQQLLDHNLKKIMEKGFTEEEARNALKANRNILEQALYNLKRRDEFKNKDMSGGKRGGFKDTKKSKSDEPVIATKPAANVSLFDFLTDKLPTNSETSDKNVSNKSDRPKSYNHDNSKPPPYHSQQSYNHQHQTSNTHYQSAVNNHQQQSHHQQQKRDQHSQQQHQQQSQSQYHQMQQQNHGNYNHANRQKFENNLSSSFATRNTNSSDQLQQHQPHDNYKNRDKNPQENVQNTNAYSSSRQKDSSEKYKNNQRNSNYGQNQQRSNERYSGSGYQKSGAGQQQTQQQSQHQSQSQHQHQLQPQHQQQSQQSQHQHQPQQQYPQDHQPQQQQQTHTQYQVKTASSSGSYDSRIRNEYQKRNGYDTGKASSNSSRYHSKDSNSHQPTVRNYNENRQQQSNTSDSGKINKLIEETSKMKIESNSTTSRIHQQQQQPQQQPQQQQQQQPQHQNSRIQSNVVVTSHHQIKPYQQHHQQQPPSQQLAPHLQQRPPSHSQHQQMQPPPQSQQPQHSIPPHTTYTQLPNGFTYDPSKIMGFQSKEANEFAMTLLKTQAAAAGAAIPPIQVATHAAYPPPIQIPPTAFPTPQFVMPPTAAAPPQMTGPYGMTQCGGENWNWKIGDRCLAKYWDDGRYYEAEVTGVSDKTCVVLFLGYGNHEEVLKCDCLPITDAQRRPINMAKLHETHQPPPPPTAAAALANAAAIAAVAPPTVAPQAVISATTIPTPLQPPLPPPASISQQHALNRGMHAASRYRGERQMYVPPPKRDG